MPLDLVLAVLPLLCAAVVVAGIVLDRRLDRASAHAAASADERFALAMVADSLIRSLDLRPDCGDALRAELHRERALVFAWLASRASRTSRAPQAPHAAPMPTASQASQVSRSPSTSR